MHLIAHGGAGGEPDEPDARQQILDDAVDRGVTETDPIEAVVEAIHALESNRRFNAGVGGAVQSDGTIRTDAGLMTDQYAAGAASSMSGVEHAVDVARIVMTETPHVLVTGDHAVDLACDFGVETGVDLWTADSRERWSALDDHPEGGPADHLGWIRDHFGGHDTVGAVATNGERVAAATSTGGRWLALAGRVGDVPQIGSGFYASPAGGASATGAGEDIAKTTLSRRAVDHLDAGHDAQEAARVAIDEFDRVTGSDAGVIVAGTDGTVGEAYTTAAMQTSVADR